MMDRSLNSLKLSLEAIVLTLSSSETIDYLYLKEDGCLI
jgi:hypothetical protein